MSDSATHRGVWKTAEQIRFLRRRYTVDTYLDECIAEADRLGLSHPAHGSCEGIASRITYGRTGVCCTCGLLVLLTRTDAGDPYRAPKWVADTHSNPWGASCKGQDLPPRT